MRLCTSSTPPRRFIIFVFSSPEQQRKFADPESGQKRSGQLRRGGVSLMPASSTARLQGRRFAIELFGFDDTSAAYIQDGYGFNSAKREGSSLRPPVFLSLHSARDAEQGDASELGCLLLRLFPKRDCPIRAELNRLFCSAAQLSPWMVHQDDGGAHFVGFE